MIEDQYTANYKMNESLVTLVKVATHVKFRIAFRHQVRNDPSNYHLQSGKEVSVAFWLKRTLLENNVT